VRRNPWLRNSKSSSEVGRKVKPAPPKEEGDQAAGKAAPPGKKKGKGSHVADGQEVGKSGKRKMYPAALPAPAALPKPAEQPMLTSLDGIMDQYCSGISKATEKPTFPADKTMGNEADVRLDDQSQHAAALGESPQAVMNMNAPMCRNQS
jgi:hypothetical protein